VVVAKPDNDPARQAEISLTSNKIDTAKASLATEESNILTANQQKTSLVQLIATADRVIARIDNLSRQIQTFITESQDDFDSLGLDIDSTLTVKIDKTAIAQKRAALVTEQQQIAAKLDPAQPGSLPLKRAQIVQSIKKLEEELDEPNKRYQAYETALKNWDNQRLAILGNKTTLDTVEYFKTQLSELDAIPAQLQSVRELRMGKAKEFHGVIRELYAPVNQFIETRPLAKEKFQLNFEVGIVDAGFLDKFFELISQGAAGTYCGVEQGNKFLKTLLARQDFDTEAGAEAFLNEIVASLGTDLRPDGKGVKVNDQLRKGKTVLALYDFIYGLEYIKPRYALRMGVKELSELSPGERGTLLLVFYLLVDKDDIPLVIDQPEENLDIRLYSSCWSLV
jgi:hypothetical protein